MPVMTPDSAPGIGWRGRSRRFGESHNLDHRSWTIAGNLAPDLKRLAWAKNR
jgi:hypothetical protein